jgi:hypothetical protein
LNEAHLCFVQAATSKIQTILIDDWTAFRTNQLGLTPSQNTVGLGDIPVLIGVKVPVSVLESDSHYYCNKKVDRISRGSQRQGRFHGHAHVWLFGCVKHGMVV